MASEAVDIAVGYDNYGQLVSITFEYPWEDGAYMNLYGNVYYSPSSSIGYGIEAMNRGEVKVRPTLQLQIDGRTANKELFWRHSARYESNVNYRFGNQFILGLAMKRMEEGEIFLAPLAKGLSNELRKKKARGEL